MYSCICVHALGVYPLSSIELQRGREIETRHKAEEPESYPEGIEYVFVNGKLVVNHQSFTGDLPGQVLRK